MQNQIKEIIDSKYAEKSYKEIGQDEELPLISFIPEDLKSVIKMVLQVAADMCTCELDRQTIINYSNSI